MAENLDLTLRIRAEQRQALASLQSLNRGISDLSRGQRELATATSQVNRQQAATERSASQLGTVLRRTAAAFVPLAVIQKTASAFMSANVEAGRLRASLETVTGSVSAATLAWEQLNGFAAETPYALDQSVQAFIRLKALGMDPSIEALRSYGNTASAMGKDLMQMVEAVADASVGEFERLKEFGIKASSQGDQVTLTFQGVATTIGRTSEEIQAYLRQIGDVQFAGAMERQMSTLGGAASNLGDSFTRLWTALGDGGIADVVAGSLKLLASGIDAITGAAQGFNSWYEPRFGPYLSGPESPLRWFLTPGERARWDGATGSMEEYIANGYSVDAGGRMTIPISGGRPAPSASELAANARAVVFAAEAEAGLPRGSLLALWGVESTYSTDLGKLGPQTKWGRAVGPFQLLPSTAAGLGLDNVSGASFEEQAKAAASYLKEGLDAYGSLANAYRFYHGGPNTGRWGPDTEAYSAKAMGARSDYLASNRLPDEEAYAAALERQQIAADGLAERTRVLNEVRERGQQIIEATRTPLEEHAARMEELVYLYTAGAFGARDSAGALETFSRASEASAEMVSKAADETERASQAAHDLGYAFESAFEQAILQGNNLRDVMQGLLQDIARIVLRETVTSQIGGAIGTIVSAAFGGMRAEGGPVSAGTAYVVGEEGLELFVPTSAGQIVPNHQLIAASGAGAMPNITINNMGAADGYQADVRQDASGGLTISFVRQLLAADIAQGGQQWTRALDARVARGF